MQQLLGFLMYRNVFGNRNVEMSFVVTSPAFSAAPTGVVVSLATAGNNRLTKVSASTSTKAQQLPSGFNAKRYGPRMSVITRGLLTFPPSRVDQCAFAL